jgi:hypothetical protein
MMKHSKICGLLLVLSALFAAANAPAGPPDWSVNPSAYQYTGSVTSAVYMDLDDVGSDGDMLGAFVGAECRGVIDAWQTPGANYLFLITIYSNQASGESLSFMYYDSGMDVVCGIAERVEFLADMIVGSMMSPMEMHIDGCRPFPPSNPIPCSACWQDTVEILSWDGGDPDSGDSIIYYVYLGTETDPPIFDSTDVYPGSTTGIIYAPPPLLDGLIYHWRIVAKDRQGMMTSGPIWSFSMGPDATDPTPWGRIKMLFE